MRLSCQEALFLASSFLICNPASSWIAHPQKVTATRRATSYLASSAAEGHDADATALDNSLQGKDIYQRVFYRFSPGSEVGVHNAVVVEERCRFTVDPERPDYILPIGPRTLILREGQVEDGEIGDDFFVLNVQQGGKTHNGAGNDVELQASIACAMYLASNPELCRGRILEIASDSGLGSLLGCVGAGFTLGGRVKDADLEEDILTIAKDRTCLFPPDLELLTISNVDDESLADAYHNLKASGISGSKVAMDILDWRIRRARGPLGNRAPAIPTYRTVVASDVAFTYPEAKELARAVANRLEPTAPFLYTTSTPLPRFVLVCPDDRDDLPYLRRILEKGYKMATSTHYLKLEKLTFHFQKLATGEPENALDDMDLELQEFKEINCQSLVAQHHPDYAGEGSGELFFPVETGEYEATGGSTFLEKDAGMSPW